MRSLFVECDTRNPLPSSYMDVNVAPLLVWDYREGTDFNVPQTPNETNMRALSRFPKGLRGVRANWFGDHRLPDAHNVVQTTSWIDAITSAVGPTGIDLVFVDNEEWPKRYPFLKTLAARLADVSSAVCNWNDCKAGSGWWGPYPGEVIGTHSCPQAYEMTDNTAVKRWMKTVRLCGPNVVAHLPICQKKIGDQWVPEYNTQNVWARTRQLIFYAAQHGIRNFVFADYMLPTQALRDEYVQFCSRALLDCDRVYPLE